MEHISKLVCNHDIYIYIHFGLSSTCILPTYISSIHLPKLSILIICNLAVFQQLVQDNIQESKTVLSWGDFFFKKASNTERRACYDANIVEFTLHFSGCRDGAIDNGASSSRENSTKKKKKKKKTKSTKSSSGAKIEVDAALADTKESVELTCNRLQPLAPVTSEKLGSSPVTPEKPGSSQVVVEADVNMTNTCTETQLSADASNNPVSVDQDDTIDRGISKDQDVTEDTSSSQQTSQTEESNVT